LPTVITDPRGAGKGKRRGGAGGKGNEGVGTYSGKCWFKRKKKEVRGILRRKKNLSLA